MCRPLAITAATVSALSLCMLLFCEHVCVCVDRWLDNLEMPGDSTAANFESILIYRQFMGLL